MAQAGAISGSFTGTGRSASLHSRSGSDRDQQMTLSLSGFGTATVNVERSSDGGATWHLVDSLTADTEKNYDTPSDYFIYSLNCSAFTAGPIVYFMAH
jgi:hypothetical protein